MMSFVKPHEGGRESHAHEHAQHPPYPLPDITSISKPSFLVFRIPIMLISIPLMPILSSPSPLPLLMPLPVHAWLLQTSLAPFHNPDVSRSVDQRTEGRLRHAQEAAAVVAAATTTLQSAAIFQYHSNGDDCGAQVLSGAVDDGVAEVMKGKLEISLSDLWTKKP